MEAIEKLVFKKKKETEKEKRHTRVYLDGLYIGYYLIDSDKLWYWEPKTNNTKYFVANTQKELIGILNKQINKEYVKLRQHFGMSLELNKC